MYEGKFPKKRYKKTIDFMLKHQAPPTSVLDLGIENPFSEVMQNKGYQVANTKGEDLDLDFTTVMNSNAEITTAFEIFEHLLAPFNVLSKLKSNYLFASIPLKLWFANAYQSKTDPWDRHYHEFEDWQFDWLLEKSGWEIMDSIQFTNPVNKIGFRPLLRKFTPRYYLVYCKRK
ncbi:methyltransferase [Psychroflexus maritimus]|uniref:Methyltransferase n=1 Tax=Psychroflexus maritimus TaxID=2714865 RepID=A0A967E6N4_9FLAO|nr:methyltransferase [Psychroflexus maritimus]NGZ89931.1 methyltransferase [Psychroflexus maritimus]